MLSCSKQHHQPLNPASGHPSPDAGVSSVDGAVQWVGLEMETNVSNHGNHSALLRLSPLNEPSPYDCEVKTEGGRQKREKNKK
ncbi:hypothetical protein AVEN_3228-1 [Araneus ventricosus]|uniref:Uncharacterized protein n=1 Tax=Araneus ventricosus TaxID=182803 RepID=A0A4Y2GAA4_ARAVE|nr:hypothetical protein AVEN_3228-1 [Araneus ventricosus]